MLLQIRKDLYPWSHKKINPNGLIQDEAYKGI